MIASKRSQNPRAVLVDDLPEEEASDGALGGSPYMCRGHASLSTNPCDELICTVYVYIYIYMFIFICRYGYNCINLSILLR